jgi:tryptophan synthase alpha subunit
MTRHEARTLLQVAAGVIVGDALVWIIALLAK